MKTLKKKLCALCLTLTMLLSFMQFVPSAVAETVSGKQNIYLDTPATVTIQNEYDTYSLYFTPETSGAYIFYSTGDADTYGSILDETGNELASNDDDGSDTNFNVGYYMTAGTTYILQAEFFGDNTGSFSVTVSQSPIISFVVNNTTVFENIDGSYYGIYDESTGEIVEYFEYYYSPSFTVTLKDGRTLTSDGFGGISIDGEYYYPSYSDDQYLNPWSIGKHTATATLMGVSTTFQVEVTESPIAGIEIDDITLIEGIDGYYSEYYDPETDSFIQGDFIYEFIPSYTVYLKDGTTIKSQNGVVLLNDLYYSPEFYDDQVELPWGVGNHQVTVKLFGFEKTVTVTVVENPYTGLAISGSNELVLTFTKKDGSTEVMNAIGFVPWWGDENVIGGILYTDKQTFTNVEFSYDNTPNNPQYDKNVTLTMGTLKSNTLEDCNWLKAQVSAQDYLFTTLMYHDYCKKVYNRAFTEYNGTPTDENITDLATLATNLYLWNYYTDDVEYVIEDGYQYAIMDIAVVKECVLKYFGISNIDLTKAAGYDAQSPGTIKVLFLDGGSYTGDIQLNFENNEWIMTYAAAYNSADYRLVKLVMDEGTVIKSIKFVNAGDKLIGDANGDGAVNISDAVMIARASAGLATLSDDAVASADVNGDNNVLISDAVLIARYAASLINHFPAEVQ